MSAATLQVGVDAIGLLGPGADNWAAWCTILQNPLSYVPAKTVVPTLNVLPAAERRRIGASVKIALTCGLEALASAGAEPATTITVFSSSGGDGENCHLICEALAADGRLLSPTRFHNSVHNAPSGYWGIASGAMLPSTSICAFDASFAAGLLEAATQCRVAQQQVLLVAYDTPYPAPLHRARPILDLFAVAMLLSPCTTGASLAGLSLSLSKSAVSGMPHPLLEQLRRGIPAARCLPLLTQMAQMTQTTHITLASETAVPSLPPVYLEYLNGRSLQVQLQLPM